MPHRNLGEVSKWQGESLFAEMLADQVHSLSEQMLANLKHLLQ